MAVEKEASRLWRGRIRDIPNQRWDPIGGCPADEYDGYAGKIAAMVRDNTTDEALMKYLQWAESVHMGLGRSDPERARTVVASIRALGAAP
ncbi:hypothetical protein [Bradyrhizobium sp. CER78]|uniref:hypothetical protein n=1 Tax=Bradyrhizobium sp. CER78 TaxID=3039162 RepID=UPI0024486F17|nr:hypothetical protein [Bradyrhizobium sp. CER78]MDH2386708.1 hypothetical protein [Bradyrhizobium sp. CER78]